MVRPARRLRLTLCTAALALLTVATGTPPVASADTAAYDAVVVPLPPGTTAGQAVALVDGPGGPIVLATASDGVWVNPATRVVSYAWTPATGALATLNERLGAPRVFINGVAADGTVVGVLERGGDLSDRRAFRWSPGAPGRHLEWPTHRDDPEEEFPVDVADVDSAGRLVGSRGGWAVDSIAASWLPPEPPVRLASRSSWAAAVNDAGQIVGSAVQGGGPVAALWCDGRLVPLSPPAAGFDAVAPREATAVSPGGVVAGRIGAHVVLWRDGTAADLGTMTREPWATGVNDSGVVVGSTGYPGEPLNSEAWRALPGGHAELLGGLVDPAAGWQALLQANDVDAGGRVVGLGLRDGRDRGFLLVPRDPLPRAEVAPGAAQPACRGAAHAPVDPTPPREPHPPRAFAVVPGPGSLTLRWQPPDYGQPLTGYRAVLETAGGQREATAPPDATELRIDGLHDGTTYLVRLFALNAVGEGASSLGIDGVPGSAWARLPYAGCPEDLVPPPGQFVDVLPWETRHAAAVDCASWWGLLAGTGDDRFSPAAPMTRGQAATALLRLVRAAEGALPADPPDAFRDDNGSVHEPAVNALAAAGLLTGTANDRAAVDDQLTRGQLVSLLVRATGRLRGEPLPAGADLFDDDAGGAHERAADAAGAAGLANGTSPRVFGPDQPVRREQVASFLIRTMDLLVTEQRARPPAGW
jgi:hypothetical protein